MRQLVMSIILLGTGVQVACPENCEAACCGLVPGDHVSLLVDNPYGAPDMIVGWEGDVVCCDLSRAGADKLFVSWPGWTGGINDEGACFQPPQYEPNSGWWVDCSQVVLDLCPYDPKTEPGVCGCGVADTDLDSDGTADCIDGCPNDPNKITPGVCGCDVADIDSDSDGVPDCNDQCPAIADVDTDGDGVLDCDDGCPSDANKTAAGTCGCGVADTDSDVDGTPDCIDGCDNDSMKILPGQCGCGQLDTDSDSDAVADCVDRCPSDKSKTSPGICGCGVADTDSDTDGISDCNDNCPTVANPDQQDTVGDGVGDACRADASGSPIPDTPSATRLPSFCGFGMVDMLALGLCGLTLLRTAGRRRSL